MSLLASVSETVRLWRGVESSDAILQFEGTEQLSDLRSNCLAWSHANQVLAYCGAENYIRLTEASGRPLSKLPFGSSSPPYAEPVSSFAFSASSRHLACGVGNQVHLWDLKRQSIVQEFDQFGGNITSVSIFQDNNVAAGDDAGIFSLINTKTGVVSRGTRPQSGAALECLDVLSSVQAPRAVCGYEDGYLGLWDVVPMSISRLVPTHRAAITSLCISPTNPKLISSCGFDGRIVMSDLTKESAGAYIEVGDRLHAISAHEGGMLIAAGTASGHILVYDWRQTKTPVNKIEAHCPHPVLALKFQNPTLRQSVSQLSSSISVNSESSNVSSSLRQSNSHPISVPNSNTHSTPQAVTEDMSDRPISNSSTVRAISESVYNSQSQLNRSGLSTGTATTAPLLASRSSPSIDSILQDVHNLKKSSISAQKNSETNRLSESRSVNGSEAFNYSRVDQSFNRPAVATSTKSIHSDVDSIIRDIEKRSPISAWNHRDKGEEIASAISDITTPSVHHDNNNNAFQGNLNNTIRPKDSGNKAMGTGDVPMEAPRSLFTQAHANEAEEIMVDVPPADYVTREYFEESIELLKYEFHREVQAVIREQARQFEMSRDVMSEQVGGLAAMLKDLLEANQRLREENESLRRIYK